MKQSIRHRSRNDWINKLLYSVNLRPEEGERTALMFAVYTATSIGLLWLEQTSVALFLTPPPDGFGSKWLPIIYIASAMIGSGLGFLYSWLQHNWALPRVLMAIVLLMALPLFIFRVTLEIQYFDGIIALVSVFVLRLWIDAEEILNDLNSQVAANQLFNIREIKRTYPIVSSGLLMGDVISGFSLPVLLAVIGLNNLLITAAFVIMIGGCILYYLTKRYKQAFPDTPVRELDAVNSEYSSRKITGSVRKYIIPLFIFFIMSKILLLLVEFQFMGELEATFETDDIASFLGIFSGILGLCELLTQWFVSSRAVERLGVFVVAMCLPVSLSILGLVTIIFDKRIFFTDFDNAKILFFSAIAIKFFDDLLRYTLIAGIEPFLFQPLPKEIQSLIQTWVQGVAEPMTAGITGGGIMAAIALIDFSFPDGSTESLRQIQGSFLVASIVIFSVIWAASAWFLRSSYVSLLVQGAEQGRLGFTNVDLKSFRRAILDSLAAKETEADQRSCIELLTAIDPVNAGEILAPRLLQLSSSLQRDSLQVMVRYPNPAYRLEVQKLIETKPNLDVLALSLRYLWLSEANLDTSTLKPYLQERVDPLVRGTAASLILQRGQKVDHPEARFTLEQMLSSSRERDRIIGVQSLPDQNHHLLSEKYLPSLLQDESPRVRCTVLTVIGEKRLQQYYPSLIKGLSYKTTREAAKKALIGLGNEAIFLLEPIATDIRKSSFLRLQAWTVMGEIGTPEVLDILVKQLVTSWGLTRRNLLRVLLKIPLEKGIEAVLEQIGRSGVETLIEQELLLLGQIRNAILDLSGDKSDLEESKLLKSALEGVKSDIWERCFLLMQLLYASSEMQAAMLNLSSDSQTSIALGLEILDNTVDLPRKRLFLELLDGGIATKVEKLTPLEALVPYQPMTPSDRVRRLLTFRHFLSDWSLACCFHLARSQRWTVTKEATLVCLRHPSSFVREAVLAYLKEASPRICLELLPVLKNDPDPLVAAQVQQMRVELGAS